MDADRRKALKEAYKSRTVIGGVCCIRCSGNGRVLLQSAKDIEGLRNRFNFAISTKGCPDPSLYDEWVKYGVESFSFSVLEELKKGDDQTDKQFTEDVKVLYEMWLEKSQQGQL